MSDKNSFAILAMLEAITIKGFRNIIAHDYLGVDVEEVWQIIKNRMPKLKAQLEEIISE